MNLNEAKNKVVKFLRADHKFYMRRRNSSIIEFKTVKDKDDYIEVDVTLSAKKKWLAYTLIFSSWDDEKFMFRINFLGANGTVVPRSKIKPTHYKRLFKFDTFDRVTIVMHIMKLPRYYQAMLEMTIFDAPLMALIGQIEKFFNEYLKLIK